jgi:hypothetical protein
MLRARRGMGCARTLVLFHHRRLRLPRATPFVFVLGTCLSVAVNLRGGCLDPPITAAITSSEGRSGSIDVLAGHCADRNVMGDRDAWRYCILSQGISPGAGLCLLCSRLMASFATITYDLERFW